MTQEDRPLVFVDMDEAHEVVQEWLEIGKEDIPNNIDITKHFTPDTWETIESIVAHAILKEREKAAGSST